MEAKKSEADNQVGAAPVMASKRSNLLRLIGTLAALGLLLYLLSQQGWAEIWAAIRQISPWRFVLAFGLSIVSRLATSARWNVLLRSCGLDITYRQTTRITYAGFFASNFLPTTIGGDVVRLAGIIQLRFDAALGAASLIMDRLVGMAGMAMVLPLCLPLLYGSGTALTLAHQRSNPLSTLAVGLWLRTIWRKLMEIGRRIVHALGLWIRQPRSLLASLGFSWVHMLCIFSILYLFLTGMGEQVSIWLISGLYSLVYFITLIPISINGYGLQEVSMTLIFSSLGGVSVSSSLTTALLFRTLMMLASLPGALSLPDILSAKERAAKDASPV
jgi:uncharacterized membrane protein YbhN (UPF0104 family)